MKKYGKALRQYRTIGACELRSKIFRQVVQKDRELADASQEIFVQHDGIRFKQGVRRDLCGVALKIVSIIDIVYFVILTGGTIALNLSALRFPNISQIFAKPLLAAYFSFLLVIIALFVTTMIYGVNVKKRGAPKIGKALPLIAYAINIIWFVLAVFVTYTYLTTFAAK